MKRKWFRRYWLGLTTGGVAVIIFIVYLGLTVGIAISFAVLSIVIATFFSVSSLKLARDSLELTRATTRPFLTLKEAHITPDILVKLVIENTGTLPAENGKYKVNIIHIQEPDRPETIHEGEIALIFPNDSMGILFPTSEPTVGVPKAHPDFVNLMNSGKEIHFRVQMNYHSFEKEYVYGQVFKLFPRQKGHKALANLVSVEGSSYYK